MVSISTIDTIAAIASPAGTGQRGVLRLTGAGTLEVLRAVFSASDPLVDLSQIDRPRRLIGNLQLSNSQLPAKVLYWPTEKSYTRQPSAEFHTFGSPPVLSMGLASLCEHGARLARPGEFTLRAFLSGRMDLTQAEAVLAVIDSESSKQLSVALEQLSGGLAGPLAEIRQQLISVLAELEAGLDFVEEDIEFISANEIEQKLRLCCEMFGSIRDQINQRSESDQNKRVTLTGLPNAGKSSLFNRLLGQDRAIVTNLAGTTTDIVSEKLTISGQTISLCDTAGYEPEFESDRDLQQDMGENAVMAAAQQKRTDRAQQSDLVVVCVAPTAEDCCWALGQLKKMEANRQASMVVLTKSDLDANGSGQTRSIADLKLSISQRFPQSRVPVVPVSSHTGDGIERLKFEMASQLASASHVESSLVNSTVLRTADSLKLADRSLRDALQAAQAEIGQEVIAAEIRQSLDSLGQIVGTIYTDDILDVVFGRFCIGK